MTVVATAVRVPSGGLNMRVLVSHSNPAPMEETLLLARTAGATILSARQLGMFGGNTEAANSLMNGFPFRTGTLVGYVEPGTVLGAEIKYTDPKTGITYLLHVPQEYRAEKNAVLVVEHPDYVLEDFRDMRVIRASHLDLVTAFPERDGWYRPDSRHGIPNGNLVGGSMSGVQYLCRTDKFIGLVVQSSSGANCGGKKDTYACLDSAPSEKFGALVEISTAPRVLVTPQ